MQDTFTLLGIISVFLFFFLAYLLLTFNSLIRKKNQVKVDFSDIIVELKRRASLIDQLILMVREYAKHEKTTFTEVTKARSLLDTSKTMQDTAQAENMFTETLRSLFAVVENYPKLQAQENYRSLMTSLEDTENRIAGYREEYNKSVLGYNNHIETFPTLLVALIFNFKGEQFYQVEMKDIN